MIPREFPVEESARWMAELGNQLENGSFEPAFNRVMPLLHDAFADNFANTKAPSGTWPPHSPVTVKIHGPHPLLILSGALLRSVTESGSDGNVEFVSAREMAVGTSLFYAGWQQHGTTKIPPRMFLWVNAEWVGRIGDEFQAAATEIIFGA